MSKSLFSLATGLLALCLVPACGGTPAPMPTPKPQEGETYESIEDTMEMLMDDLVETRIPKELNKDPAQIDFPMLARRSALAARLFGRCAEKGDPFYLRKARDRDGAIAAAKWFGDLQAAAGKRDLAAMLRIYGAKKRICGACHDY